MKNVDLPVNVYDIVLNAVVVESPCARLEDPPELHVEVVTVHEPDQEIRVSVTLTTTF